MKLLLLNDGKIKASEPLTADSSASVTIELEFVPRRLKINAEQKLMLFIKGENVEGSFFAENEKVTVPADLFGGDYVVFGCALTESGVTLKKWQSEPIGVSRERFYVTLTDDFKKSLERIETLEKKVEKLERLITGYTVL